jgi:hypothetical protein
LSVLLYFPRRGLCIYYFLVVRITKAPPYEVIYLSHTAYECPRLRYSVSREAPEELKAGKDRKDLTGNGGAISPE